MSVAARCLAVGLGVAIDRVTAEPPDRRHPVAWFGTVMGRFEGAIWRDRRWPGVLYATVGTAIGAVGGWAARSTAGAVAVSVAGPQLRSTASAIAVPAAGGDLDEARRLLPALVGRDPTGLEEAGVAAAVIESVAENSVDAVVAPIVWALAGGAPAVGAYRAINTMDAMVGHRSDRYRRFGWAAARLDDAANYVPARVFAVLVALHAPGRRRDVWSTVRRDARRHPSPNAGVAEAAVAAALGVQLGGTLRYGDRVEHRPTLGTGPRPAPGHIAIAVDLAARVERTLTLTTAVVGIAALIADVRRRRIGHLRPVAGGR